MGRGTTQGIIIFAKARQQLTFSGLAKTPPLFFVKSLISSTRCDQAISVMITISSSLTSPVFREFQRIDLNQISSSGHPCCPSRLVSKQGSPHEENPGNA